MKRLSIVLVAFLMGIAALPALAQDSVTVFAAASLKDAMDEISSKWMQQTAGKIAVSLAGSSALARQIEQGAPADVFVSADEGWMDQLQKEGLIDEASRFDLVANSIVLIAYGKDAPKLDIGPGFDLAGLLGDQKLAMALVDSVPAGIYGKASLTSLGIWDAVAPKVAQADNVRAALALVATGEAPYGIVYSTDAAADDNVSVVGTFPADSHPPIVYPAATVKDSANPLKSKFLEFLKSDAAKAAFERQGFRMAR